MKIIIITLIFLLIGEMRLFIKVDGMEHWGAWIEEELFKRKGKSNDKN